MTIATPRLSCMAGENWPERNDGGFYAKAVAPGQRAGIGWRRALFHALSETPDSRSAEPATTEKKSPGNGLLAPKKVSAKRKQGKKQPLQKSTDNIKKQSASRTKKQKANKPATKKKKATTPKAALKKGKKNKSKSGGPKQLKLF